MEKVDTRYRLPIFIHQKPQTSVRAKLFWEFAHLSPSDINRFSSAISIVYPLHQLQLHQHPWRRIVATPALESIEVSTRAHRGQYSRCALVVKILESACIIAQNQQVHSFDAAVRMASRLPIIEVNIFAAERVSKRLIPYCNCLGPG